MAKFADLVVNEKMKVDDPEALLAEMDRYEERIRGYKLTKGKRNKR